MHEHLTDDNFMVYCARHYDNPQCHSDEEFFEDINRVRYIKKLITRYTENNDLKERLILNHVIILGNLFGLHTTRILYLKLRKQFQYIKPFLVLLNMLPDHMYNIGGEAIINTDLIPMDETIVQALRAIRNESI